MKRRSISVLAGLLIIFSSCRQSDVQTQSTDTSISTSTIAKIEHPDVKALRETLPAIATPVTFNSNEDIGITSVDPGDNDLLVKQEKKTGFVTFGKIFETERFIAILGFVPNDAGTPILVTFDKTGQVISSHMLYETVMGDMGRYTSNAIKIWPNRQIDFIDSTVTRQINAAGDDEIPGTDSLVVTKKKYTIRDTGTIEQMD